MEVLSDAIARLFNESPEVFGSTIQFMEELFETTDSTKIALSLNGGKDSTAVLFLALFFFCR